MEDIKKYLIKQAKPAPWMYPAEQFTNEKFEDIIVTTVRAKLLDFLPQEVPYLLKTNMELFEMNENGKCMDSKTPKVVPWGTPYNLKYERVY